MELNPIYWASLTLLRHSAPLFPLKASQPSVLNKWQVMAYQHKHLADLCKTDLQQSYDPF